MTLPLRLLDDASFDTLQQQLRSRLPALTPEWTDWNPSDPGIALLDLVAFAAEGLLWRFNQIPEATQLAFLRLLGLPLQTATAARALLAFSSQRQDGARSIVPQHTQARAGSTAFAIERETPVWPGELLALIRRRSTPPASNELELAAALQPSYDALGLSQAEGTRLAHYDIEFIDGSLARDPAQAVDDSVWLAWLAPEKPTELPPAWRKADRLTIGWWPAAAPDDGDAPLAASVPCPGIGAAAVVRGLEWRVLAHDLVQGQPDWRPLAVQADDTDGGSRPGLIELELPDDPEDLLPPLVPPGLEGTGAFPPPLPPALAARVRLWLRAFPALPSRPLPPLLHIKANTAWASQAIPQGAEYLGRGDGQPAQRFQLGQRPVLVDAQPVELEVEEPGDSGVWVPWTQVQRFDLSGPEDRHFLVDAAAGEIRFGPRGPALSERVRVLGYRVGGGSAGNVGAGAIKQIDIPQLKLANPEPARGGRDAEAVEQALSRIPGEITRRDRAVTADDFRQLAEATPGAAIARAEVLPLFDPRTQNPDRAGAVTVIVWPEADAERERAPRPDAQQRAAVCAHLDARRLVGTELFVIAPRYRRVAVSCSVATEPGFGPEAARRLAAQILQRYLSPLPPYGPLGRGWPLGRTLRDRELIAAVLQIDGIEYVERLRLAVELETGWSEQATVELRPWEVVELVAVQVVDASQTPPAPQDIAPPPDVPTVPVPVIRDICS